MERGKHFYWALGSFLIIFLLAIVLGWLLVTPQRTTPKKEWYQKERAHLNQLLAGEEGRVRQDLESNLEDCHEDLRGLSKLAGEVV